MSAVKTKKTGSFKETAKKKADQAKEYVSKKYDSAKSYARNYADDISKAYEIGYKKGWGDAYDIPKRFGARTTAAFGYHRGVAQRHKADKYVEKYKKWNG